jgi:malate dehydrogenase
MKKISIIGAGNTGATAAHWIAERELADVVCWMSWRACRRAKASTCSKPCRSLARIRMWWGRTITKIPKNSDIIIITAGIARKPGMSREDLLKTNAEIVGKAATET